MSTETAVNQINENLNQQFNKPDFTAQLSELMYAESLNVNEPHRDQNGNATLYSQFYDNSGNVRNNITGDVKIYLENHKTDSGFVTKLQDYNVVAISGDNLDGYAGMVISPQDNNKEAIHISRGSENPLTHPNDWLNNAEMGVFNGIGEPENSLQFQSAQELLKKAKINHPEIEVVSTTGHSQGGALAIAMEKVIIQTQGLTLGWTKAYNPPGFATSATEGMTPDQISEMKSKTQIISVAGDPVSETFLDHLVPPIKVYSDAPAGVDRHYMAQMVTENKTSLYTDYINSDNSINVENVSNAYNQIVAKEKLIIAEMASSDTNSWLDYIKSAIPDSIEGLFGVTNYSEQLADIAQQKAGLAEILKGSVTSFEGEIEFWSQEFDKHSPELAEMLKLNRCLEPSLLLDVGANQTQASILEFIGGENNKKLLDAVVDSIKLQETPQAQEQFLNSLENGGLLESLLGSDAIDSLGIRSVDKLVLDKFRQASTQRYGDPLVVDLDGSGTIDTGRELFGDNTLKVDGTKAKDGFDALSDLDSNNDGVFSEHDSTFSEVKVWQDKDQDGQTDSGELLSLAEAGISSIDLNAKTVNQSVAGGILRKTSTVTKADGTTAAVGAMDFAENKFYSEFVDELEVSQDLQNSINVAGQGALRSLHESASLSPELNDLLTGLYSGDTPVTDSAIHEVLLEWAKSAENFETSLEILDGVTLDDGTQINVGISDRVRTVIEKTAVLEALNGSRILEYNIRDNGSTYTINAKTGTETFWDTRTVAKGGTTTTGDWFFHRLADNARATHISEGYASAFNSIKESVETSFIVREIQPFLLENLSFELDDAGEVALNFDGINEAIVEKIKADPSSGINFFNNVIQAKELTFLKDDWEYAPILGEADFTAEQASAINALKVKVDGKQVILSSDASDTLHGSNLADAIYAKDGNDKLYGNRGNDLLDGGAGDDVIHSGHYDRNTLVGGTGDDSIYSEYRAVNTIKYNLGDGFDTVRRNGNWRQRRYENQFNDKVVFGEGIAQENIKFSKQGNHLIINVDSDASQGMKIENYYSLDNYYRSKVSSFEFSDGTILNRTDVNPDIVGDDGNDTLSGTDWRETLRGEAGDDKLYGRGGNDTLLGGAGNDRLEDYDGRNVLDGGEGNDTIVGEGTLLGGAGDDALHGDRYTSNTLEGGAGNDRIYTRYRSSNNTIKYNLGDDFDTIHRDSQGSWRNLRYENRFNDRVLFGEGITQENLTFKKQGNHLLVTINGDESQGMRVDNFYSTDNYYKSKVNRFEFADGTVLARGSAIFNISEEVAVDNSVAGQNITGTNSNDEIAGTDGNDRIDGRHGHDKLAGGKGNDIIYTGDWYSDQVEGGEGNDTIVSGWGNSGSTYTYNLGDGFDTIKRGSTSSRYTYFNHKVQFGEGIAQEDVSFAKQGNHLLVTINGDETQGMRVENFYSTHNGYKSLVEHFDFADGSRLSRSDLNVSIVGDDGLNTLSGSDWGETLQGKAEDDTIYGRGGNDTIEWEIIMIAYMENLGMIF